MSAGSRGLIFFDTNILVYQFDRADPAKQEKARRLIRSNLRDERGVISTQVAQEFLNVATLKFRKVLPLEELEWVMEDLLEPLCRHAPTMEYYRRAVRLQRSIALSFYDALIVQAAIDLGCATLYSEDMQDGRKYGGLTITNPFLLLS